MIANMLKYTFLVYHNDYIGFLEQIRKAGIVHIKEKEEGVIQDTEIANIVKSQQQIAETVKFLKSRKVDEAEVSHALDAVNIVEKIKYLRLQIELKKADIQAVNKEIALLEPWGKFSWKTISNLKQAGSFLHFFACSKSSYDLQWKTNYNLFEISRIGAIVYFVIIGDTDKAPDIKADLMKLPEKNIKELYASRKEIEIEIDEINAEMNYLAASGIQVLNEAENKNKAEIDFKNVVLQGTNEADNKVKVIEGWIPEDQEDGLVETLDQTGVFYLRNKPTIKDNVPVLLKNNAFSKLFELVGSLYSLPNYREIDLTPFFAPFFMLFFGFCLGDTGYGLIIMLATLLMIRKAKPNMKPVWKLGFLFGIATVLMGIVGGTFFGVMLVDLDIAWLEKFKAIMLDQNQLMVFSVVLGIIQIVFGMCLKAARAIKLDGIMHALSTIGWIVIIVGVGGSFGLSKTNMLNADLAKYLMIGFGAIGGVLALFFNSPGKNIFLNLGLGLWDTYGTVTGLLGDVLSYIRLFALGLSSAILGNVFNQLAFDLTGDIPVVSQLLTVLILLVGHSINFFMAALGAFVHPLRLTFVEFYKNTGFSGGGKAYQPFREMEEAKY